MRTGRGIIPLEESTPVHAAELFCLKKVCADSARNFSTAGKQANSARGIIPFQEIACGQQTEFFRLTKVRADSLWNSSV